MGNAFYRHMEKGGRDLPSNSQYCTEYNAKTLSFNATCVPLLKHAFKTQLTTCFQGLKIYSTVQLSQG